MKGAEFWLEHVLSKRDAQRKVDERARRSAERAGRSVARAGKSDCWSKVYATAVTVSGLCRDFQLDVKVSWYE